MADVQQSSQTLCRRLFHQARPYWLMIAAIFLLDLLATPLALLNPLPLRIAVDSVLGSEPLPGVLEMLLPSAWTDSALARLWLAAGLQVALVFLTQLQALSVYQLRTYTGESMTLRFQSRLLHHAQRLSLAYHDLRGTADTIYRIQYDAPSIQWVSIYGILPIISSLLLFFAMVVVMVQLDWQLALVALAISPCLFYTARQFNLRMRGRYHDARILASDALKVVQEVLTSIRVVQAFGGEQREQTRFQRQTRQGIRARLQLALAESLFGLIVNLTTAAGTALVMFIGIRSVQSGQLTLGELLMVLTYLAQLYGPMKSLSHNVAQMQSSLAGAQRAFDLLDEYPDVVEKPQAKPVQRARGNLEFQQVTFAYDGKFPILKDISFGIDAGTRLGIAGHTGAGKTTLTNLVTRFYDPSAGRILLDGIDLRDYKLADLRRQFAIVLQEPVLFSSTIAENIAYARPEATDDDIIAAAKAAHAHEFIMALPDGYDTLVGERGMRLSGGERQRISLARAFLKDAPILILDEPTSSVDTKTESLIIDAMSALMAGRTTLMIAHRLSTLDSCNARLEIEHGSVVGLSGDIEPATQGEGSGDSSYDADCEPEAAGLRTAGES
jgi:ATP-binding cassette subfamily B protein